MTEQRRPADVIGALPHRRPERRSEKRDSSSRDAKARAQTTPPPQVTAGRDDRRRGSESPFNETQQRSTPRGAQVVGTMVQAAAELAEIGLSATARAVREAVARLPRP